MDSKWKQIGIKHGVQIRCIPFDDGSMRYLLNSRNFERLDRIDIALDIQAGELSWPQPVRLDEWSLQIDMLQRYPLYVEGVWLDLRELTVQLHNLEGMLMRLARAGIYFEMLRFSELFVPAHDFTLVAISPSCISHWIKDPGRILESPEDYAALLVESTYRHFCDKHWRDISAGGIVQSVEVRE